MTAIADALLDQVDRYYADPVAFVREVLGAEPDEWQLEVLEAVALLQRICLKASKGPGKSTLLAWIGWWWLCTRLHPKVVCTSISGDNLRDNLWSELAKWQAKSPFLQQNFTWTAERITHNDHPATWWCSARQWSKDADANKQGEALAGVHADNVLFLVDEAGGVPDAVVATAEAGLANTDSTANREARLVIAGNPTQTSGPLYRACTSERGLWWVKEISGDPDDPKRAPRVSITWAREQISKFGRDNPWVLINVFGKFPPTQSNTFMGVEEVTTSATRLIQSREYQDEAKILGVDVARFGDDRSVVIMRQGRYVWNPKVFRNMDTMTLASKVAEVIDTHKPEAVFIDVVGIGSGVVDRLRQLGYPVLEVLSGGESTDPKYANLRSMMWGHMADWLRGGGVIPDIAELRGELPGPTYTFDRDGKMALEQKKDMKKRGLASPDIADALAFTFAAPVSRSDARFDHQREQRRKNNDFNPYATEVQ